MIDPTCRIFCETLSVPESSRVDAFCVLTGQVVISEYVHVSTGARLLGSGGVIHLGFGSNVSVGCSLLTVSDDLTTPTLAGPCVPEQFRNVIRGGITLKPFAGVAAHCVVMPNVTIGFGARVGANSFVKQSIPDGEIWAGSPAKKIGEIDLQELRLRTNAVERLATWEEESRG